MSNQEKAILDIINSIDGQPNVNPTEIYNEGWMTRLLVYYSIQEKLKLKNIDFDKIKNWTSEGRITNPFLNAEKIREGHTHADMALGDFNIKFQESGEIKVEHDARVFGIIEAKMKSSLSSGTTHAPTYDQASRNVACIANNVKNNAQTFFYVVAPEVQIIKQNRNKQTIIDMVNPEAIEKQIKLRFELHSSHNDPIENEEELLDQVLRCDIDLITYEEWIRSFNNESTRNVLDVFYQKCLQWNRIIPFKN